MLLGIRSRGARRRNANAPRLAWQAEGPGVRGARVAQVVLHLVLLLAGRAVVAAGAA